MTTATLDKTTAPNFSKEITTWTMYTQIISSIDGAAHIAEIAVNNHVTNVTVKQDVIQSILALHTCLNSLITGLDKGITAMKDGKKLTYILPEAQPVSWPPVAQTSTYFSSVWETISPLLKILTSSLSTKGDQDMLVLVEAVVDAGGTVVTNLQKVTW